MTSSVLYRQLIAGLITLSLSVLPPPARALFGAGDIVYDPANYAQNVLTAARALQSNLNEAMEIANQLHQIEMEARNLARLPQAAWDSVRSDLNQLRQLAQSASGISYALQRLSTQFKELYPGYQAPTNYEQQYQQWTDNSLTGIQQALKAAQQQSQQFEQESTNTQSLTDLSSTADGQMQALQAGNMIALQLVNQLQALRHLQVMETQAQNLYMASQLQNQAEEKAAIKTWLDSDIGYQSKM
jgi:P-type conjugative transfer protein TrbJ